MGEAWTTPLRSRASDDNSAQDSETSRNGEQETLLLVEDERAILSVFSRLLMRCGFHVLVASSGDEALRVVEQHAGSIALLITDFSMPGMSGAALARRLLETRPELQVLFISGYPGDELDLPALGLSDSTGSRAPSDADAHFLTKPFSVDAFLAKISGLLDRSI